MPEVERVAVRDLVAMMMPGGDLVPPTRNRIRAVDGTRSHVRVQSSRPEGYRKEVTVSFTVEHPEIVLEIHGRIDGILERDGTVVVEEIKTTGRTLAELRQIQNCRHLAQAQVYSYIYASQNDLREVDIHITYCHAYSGETKTFEHTYSLVELGQVFHAIVRSFLAWLARLARRRRIRNDSIARLTFPFASYRAGQREMAVQVYRATATSAKLFVRAPTGIGKTMATLFPAVKAVGEGLCTKIFYLTARSTAAQAAETALARMHANGLKLRSITLTAKAKVCFREEPDCHPDLCEYSRGYYDRLRAAIDEILETGEAYTRPVIEQVSRKHRVCPFEFSLDLSLLADCVICDYNYLYDPRVYLRRYFLERPGDYLFLVDEAHNLVDRARSMYSAPLGKREFMTLKRSLGKARGSKLAACLNAINRCFIALRKGLQERELYRCAEKEKPEELCELLDDLVELMEPILFQDGVIDNRDEMLELFFRCLHFLRIGELFDDHYATTMVRRRNDVDIKLLCLDPSELLRERSEKGRATVFFSATLFPRKYFFHLLGGGEHDRFIAYPSSFPEENARLLLVDSISTRFRDRESTYDRVAACLSSLVAARQGNYLLFFPSYAYMDESVDRFIRMDGAIRVLKQERGMPEEDRQAFLAQFVESPGCHLAGFAVMGGIFGEAIDLVGERLTGVAVVGVGLPQISFERDLMLDYFNRAAGGRGFHYAYTYPGMSRVLQAAGRVIRTETDRGVILLIDDRFATPVYRGLYPPEWGGLTRVGDLDRVGALLKQFWG